MNDERLKKSEDPARQSRVSTDRAFTEDRNLTDAERVQMFRTQPFAVALPDLPDIPGYHVCWLTTQNPRDSIQARTRLGYQLIRGDELPGFEFANQKTGEFAGYIVVNEMIAAKIPLHLYESYMTEAHHNMPAAEESKLMETAEFLKREAQRSKGDVIEEEGIAAIRESASRRAPRFA